MRLGKTSLIKLPKQPPSFPFPSHWLELSIWKSPLGSNLWSILELIRTNLGGEGRAMTFCMKSFANENTHLSLPTVLKSVLSWVQWLCGWVPGFGELTMSENLTTQGKLMAKRNGKGQRGVGLKSADVGGLWVLEKETGNWTGRWGRGGLR